MSDCIFHKKDPIIIGVEVVRGVLRVGTPIMCRDIYVGVVEGVEIEKKPINNVRASNGPVCIRIKSKDSTMEVGKQFTDSDLLYSKLSRNAIDILKLHFKEDLVQEDLKLIVEIKKLQNIL